MYNSCMKFVKINKKNIMLATKMQIEIFNDEKECAYLHYLNSFISKKDYYIVYENNEVVGISGLYIDEFTQEKGVVWLGWFGVAPAFRGKGFGRKILEQTIERAKKKGFDILRLYTSPTNLTACNLYNKVMDICENYMLEGVKDCIVYSLSLKENLIVSKLGKKYLGIKWHEKEQKEGLKLFKRRLNENWDRY